MAEGFRVFRVLAALLIVSCMAGVVTAASIGTEWKERVQLDGSSYRNVMMTSDGSRVFAGGTQLYVRNWDGEKQWTGRSGYIATMSADGNYVVFGLGNSLMLLNKDGVEDWTRNMDGEVRAVAISGNGSYIVSADDRGNLNTWDVNGNLYGRNKTDTIKQIAVSPLDTLVVATTDSGLKFFTPALDPVWSDTKNGSVDTEIIFSSDGSTIITSGGKRVSSHTNTGKLNWMKDITKNAIIGTACSYDCSVIVVGSQDSNVRAIDRYGVIHWTYPVEQWVNSVAVSRDGNVIVAAGIDKTLHVLDLGGNVQARKTMNSIIHPRSIAISADGRRIAVADEYALNGFTLTPDTDGIGQETVIPLTTRYTYTPTPVPTTGTTVIETPVTSVPVTAVPVTTTPKSPLNPVIAIFAVCAVLCLVQWGRKH
jgi:WD40 repeat protein